MLAIVALAASGVIYLERRGPATPGPTGWSGVVLVVTSSLSITQEQREALSRIGDCRFEWFDDQANPSGRATYPRCTVLDGDEILAFRGPWDSRCDPPRLPRRLFTRALYRVPGRWPALSSGRIPRRGAREAVLSDNRRRDERVVTLYTLGGGSAPFAITGRSFTQSEDVGMADAYVRSGEAQSGCCYERAGIVFADEKEAVESRARILRTGCGVMEALLIEHGAYVRSVPDLETWIQISYAKVRGDAIDIGLTPIPATRFGLHYVVTPEPRFNLPEADIEVDVDGKPTPPRTSEGVVVGQQGGGLSLDLPPPGRHEIAIKVRGRVDAVTTIDVP